MAYDIAEPGNAYLTYKVEDAPNVSYKAYLNAHGKSYTWLRRNRLANEPEYKRWRERQLQDYDTYLKMYDSNYNASASQRARLEQSNFSGQYLANGIGTGSSTAAAVNPGLYDNDTEQRGSKGLNKVMQSLELMSAAGIAMKNFGEGKTAMKYADDLAGQSLYNSQQKGRGLFYDAGSKELRYNAEFMLQNDPSVYGYEKVNGRWMFTGVNDVPARNMRLEAFLQNIDSTEGQMILRDQQRLLNTLTYENRQQYEAATMKAQQDLLEGKKALQDIEKDYATALKRMGLAMPLLKAAMESLKLFL